jgi:DEAD/DEAH box helicase domain-containing protein
VWRRVAIGLTAPLLPLRVHGFLRAIPGLWSCINPACLQSPADWSFGAITMERIEACPNCSSPILEIMACRECGEPYLDGEERNGHLLPRYTPPTIDEFAALRERELADEDETERQESQSQYESLRLAVASRTFSGARIGYIDPHTGQRFDRAEDGSIPYQLHDPSTCGACGATQGAMGQMLRPFRYGAPFLIGNAAPVMLEGVDPRKLDDKKAYRPPADGRQLLSFTDSRQGTARFAANLQTNAERGFVRGYIYHAVQGSMAATYESDPEVVKLQEDIASLEPAIAQLGDNAPAQLTEMLKGWQAALIAKSVPSTRGIAWPDLRKRVADQPEVHHWMARVWGAREDRYRKEPGEFAEFLLLREFNRRPRRGNTAETMGLARLRFVAIDHTKELPELLRSKGLTLADWHGLLYSIIDMTVRGQFAIRADWNDLHWMHTNKPMSLLLPPGEVSEARRELSWPRASGRPGLPSNLVLILERTLKLDRMESADRQDLNDILDCAWQALRPLLYSPERPGYALDFTKAHIAPVVEAWRCPVSRKILPEKVLGLTQYGHREGLSTAELVPEAITLPRLPIAFPRGNEINQIREWLKEDPIVGALREKGVWANLHDRVALLSPYLRAAEHSAQQPPERLRRFESEFKAGEINILCCSTTMEMGVDIGSVSAVMMTNVPPSLANFRQRVGRAGRRRQGFASSLTYTRDTPLDREAFRDPALYLSRETKAPRVNLDSRRIVQRHVNALLLSLWFAGAGGEAMKARAGDFFGCPEGVGSPEPEVSPAIAAISWMRAPSTQAGLAQAVETLVSGTVLQSDRGLFEDAARNLEQAKATIREEWSMLQAQAASVSRDEGRASIEYQIKRLARENLLKELAVRGVLPAHGLPTAVVPFVHDDKPNADDIRRPDDDSSRRRRSYPSRTLDIAIRDYAPGAEVVVDGLVFKSAGLTLNWQRPADDEQAREVQAIGVFWTCPSCGAADCERNAPIHCPACHQTIPFAAQRRFLEPAGFTVDMGEKPHADTDEVTYVEPEAEQIVARHAAWQPMADPQQGRVRASSEGLVFYSSRGASGTGYHICLECGRAETAGAKEANGGSPLKGHKPLRGTRRNVDGLCPGNEKSFKITTPIALGYQTITDVAELQPADLSSEGAAWAAISALREALARHLGVETNELGIAVRPAHALLGQRTNSMFLYDRASGGAGFATQAVADYDLILRTARDILDCQELGCTHGCSACILTSDLFRQQEILDRKTALVWAEEACASLTSVPDADGISPQSRYSRSLADEVVSSIATGASNVTVWVGPETDVAEIAHGLFALTARRIAGLGGQLRLVVPSAWLDGLDPASRLALRDAAKMLELDLRKGDQQTWPNDAQTLAQCDGPHATVWTSRDMAAAAPGPLWGNGQQAPIIRSPAGKVALAAAIDPDSLLPPSDTRFLEITNQLDGDLAAFGIRFAKLIVPEIRAAGGIGNLEAITYSDRYLQSPLTVRLLVESLVGLRDGLNKLPDSMPTVVITNPLRQNDRQPFAPDHDWQFSADREEVFATLMEKANFTCRLIEQGAPHGRMFTLKFSNETTIKVVLDQGFGPWRTPRFARFEFGVDAVRQSAKLASFNALVSARGSSYVVVIG